MNRKERRAKARVEKRIGQRIPDEAVTFVRPREDLARDTQSQGVNPLKGKR